VKCVLVIDGNTAATRASQIAAGGCDSGDAYATVLRELAAGLDLSLECEVLRPADSGGALPAGRRLRDYAGAAITGSALNVYNDLPEVNAQIALAREILGAGLPFFGSCWGLQVAVAAAGGRVAPNPLGPEFGFARRIELNAAGRVHPMFNGKPPVFEAITVHRDCVMELPAGGVELARNEMGLQAAEIRHGRTIFWGVQYHPEYTLREIAATARRYAHPLLQDGLFRGIDDVGTFGRELELLDSEPGNRALGWRHGLGAAVLDAALRRCELRNWLADQVF
jgi:GMP synthase (glutamine-hydrolysing)